MKQKEERSTSINVNGIKFHILLHQAANALVLNYMMKLNYFGSFLGDKNIIIVYKVNLIYVNNANKKIVFLV